MRSATFAAKLSGSRLNPQGIYIDRVRFECESAQVSFVYGSLKGVLFWSYVTTECTSRTLNAP